MTKRIVLTSTHVGSELGASVEVRINRAKDAAGHPEFQFCAATIVWSSIDLGVTLMALVSGVVDIPFQPVQLASKPLNDRADLVSAAYPRAVHDRDVLKFSGHLAISGRVVSLKDGELQLTVDASMEGKSASSKSRQWDGASGMPVLVDGVCYGVVRAVQAMVPNQLVATPVSSLRQIPDFDRLVRTPLEIRRLNRLRSILLFVTAKLRDNKALADHVLAFAQKKNDKVSNGNLADSLVGSGSTPLTSRDVCFALERAASVDVLLRDVVRGILEVVLPAISDPARWPPTATESTLSWIPLDTWHAGIADLLIAGSQQLPARLVRDPDQGVRGAAGHLLSVPGQLQNAEPQRGLLLGMMRAFGITGGGGDVESLARHINTEGDNRIENAAAGGIGGTNVVPLYLLVREASDDSSGLEALRELLQVKLGIKSVRLFQIPARQDNEEDDRIMNRFESLL